MHPYMNRHSTAVGAQRRQVPQAETAGRANLPDIDDIPPFYLLRSSSTLAVAVLVRSWAVLMDAL